jgi:uncharacterized protein
VKLPMRRRLSAVVLVAAVLTVGCDREVPGPVDTAAATDASAVPLLHPDIDAWDEAVVGIVGRELAVAVKVAETPGQRARGLMHVPVLPDGVGMLFVFERNWSGGFWMKDTLVPLDIAFVDTDGVIVAVDTMTPCADDPCPVYDPGVAYTAALEVPAGWLEANDVGPGDRLTW